MMLTTFIRFLPVILLLLQMPDREEINLEFHPIAGGLQDARSVFVSSSGNLFVAETGRNRILKLSGEGNRLDSLGRLGSGDYQFDRPVNVDATNELKIYVADYTNGRVQIFDRRFQYLATVSLPGRIQRDRRYSPLLVRVNYTGDLFFYDEDNRYFYKFNSSGQFEQRFASRSDDGLFVPSYICTLGDDLFIADSRRNLIHRFSDGGTYQGFFATQGRIRGLKVAGGEIWTAEGNAIQVYDARGQLLRSYSHDIDRIRDIAVFRGQVFLLTSDKLYKAVV